MPPLIKRAGRGTTGLQLGLVVSLGIISGIYIWKPVFDRSIKDKAKQIADEAREKKQSSETVNIPQDEQK